MLLHSVADRRGEDGFTLVETLAALLVFALMTIGLIPLLISSLQGSDLSRSMTINKNAAVEAMERVRGLPYHVSFGSQSSKVDVLDLYFPQLAAEAGIPGQSYAGGTYTTVCNNGNLANPACPRNIPQGTTLRFAARFVNAAGALVTPPAGYTWNSTAGADVPPSPMLDLSITAEWTQRGRPRTMKLQSLVGDRKFGGIKVRGEANIEFGVQVLTSYSNSAGELSELLALAGNTDAGIETRSGSSADIAVRAGDIRLSKLPTDTQPIATELDSALGAAASHHAPPDSTPASVGASDATVTHPELFDPNDAAVLFDVAGMDSTSVGDLGVGVQAETPHTSGDFSYAPGLASLDFWVQTQVDPLNNDLRRLDTSQPAFSIRGNNFGGSATGVTGALEAVGRRVETTAEMRMDGLRLLPTDFISGFDASAGGALIEVTGFQAETNCVASDNSTTASATATWSATLRYWADVDAAGADKNDGVVGGSYQTLALNGGSGTELLGQAQLRNPLVYDGDLPTDDIYLFEAGGKNGYLKEWSSLKNVAGAEDPTGRFAQAQIAGAIKIDTAPTNPAFQESGLNIQIGQLRCEALDER